MLRVELKTMKSATSAPPASQYQIPAWKTVSNVFMDIYPKQTDRISEPIEAKMKRDKILF